MSLLCRKADVPSADSSYRAEVLGQAVSYIIFTAEARFYVSAFSVGFVVDELT